MLNACNELSVEIVNDHIALVTLNRPSVRNAINPPLTLALDNAVAEIEATPAIRAVVLASSHATTFCAGADLAEIAAGRGHLLATNNGGFAGFVLAPRNKPWIAAIGGSAFAGGFEIALACDMIVAGHNATFGLPEVRRGLLAGAGGVYRLPKRIPRNIALELIATGGVLNAARAYELGLANRLVPNEAVLETSLELAGEIAKNAPLSVTESLQIARTAGDYSEELLEQVLEFARERVLASEDAIEGPRAFLEKRDPVWKGR